MTKITSQIYELLSGQFQNRFKMREVRPGIFQLYLPFYHEDGDMVEMYLDLRNTPDAANPAEEIRISDFGMTIMRLSYNYELDTPNKELIFSRILAENKLSEQDGNLCYVTRIDSLLPAIFHFSQALAKISSMRQFKREMIESLFFEQLDTFIMNELSAFKPQKNITPIPDRHDLEVDYQLNANGHPIYLFAVKDANKARLATISCLEFVLKKLPFKSYIVHHDFEQLPKKDRTRIMSASDKQFPNLADFTENARLFLERESTLSHS
ncbi:MAG: DUF1828 domain-containing protein [Candidatus Cyclonatronum sp.]|uniref:DUF1828 domain-containing protein n=1 Tax=Cyclonatronum sp. TaxID=3024185 RepID=UPI0025B8C4B7|nr:DUF1828 domain-containing protein [Cyclonatronum sp.]MCH8487894.1 DUF1828 domain-containing protein [Cyclonatronum sp.]